MFTFPITFLTNASTGVTIPFDSLGGNDIFYYLGTNKNTEAWVNPSTRNLVVTGASSLQSGTGTIALIDRASSDVFTTNTANSWFRFDFITAKVNPNYYVLQSRSASTSNLPRNWKLQGSTDNSIWIDLDSRVNNTSLTSTNQRVGFTCSSSTSYRYIRLLQNGVESSGTNFFTLGEFYIYGQLE